MDILAYAAQKRAVDLCNCLCNCVAVNQAVFNSGNTIGYSACLDTNLQAWGCNCYGYTYPCFQVLGREALDKTPWCYCNWVSIPTFAGGNTSFAGTNVNGFKVCSTSVGTVGSGCGATCTFTVPGGVSFVRFQLWGAGGNAGSGCCCGGSGFGSTGAYASVILPAITGCQYNIFAGAICCSTPYRAANYSNYTLQNGPSYVQGYGLNNFCAMGGRGFAAGSIMGLDISAVSVTTCCKWASPDCVVCSGACICNTQADYCFAGCSSCGVIPVSKTNTTKWYGTNTLNINCCCSLAACSYTAFWWGQVVGFNGLNGSASFDINFCGCNCHPPIYGFESVSRCILCADAALGLARGGLCCNGCAYDFMRYPGAGGTAVYLYGACIASCDPSGCFGAVCGGDIGRGGMVCVSYC
jgi:hypothetical protein